MSSIKLNTTSGGSISIVPQDTASDVVFTMPATTATIVTSDVLAAPSGSSLVGFLQSGTGAVATTVQTKLRETVRVKDFGAVGDGADDRTAIQNAINAVAAMGGGMVLFEPGKTYGINSSTRPYLTLRDGVGLDLNGSTIQRLGANYTHPMIENDNVGGTVTTRNHIVKNGKIMGTGAPGQVSDQGAALLFWQAENVIIENIETENTNGDGLQFRNAENTVIEDCVIGDYGRNGISPTSGSFVYRNVKILGNPITGANPGIGLDAENNAASEYASHYFDYIEATDMTFVDFYAPAGTAFRHDIFINAGKIGGQSRALRFLAANNTVAKNIYIGSEVEISATGTNGSCVTIDNVGGVQFYGGKMKVGTATGSPNGIKLEGTVAELKLRDVKFEGAFSSAILALGATAITGIDMSGCGSHPRLYLDNVTNSVFSNATASNVTLANATTGNIFTPDFRVTANSWTLIGGATKENQRIGYILTEAEIDAEYQTGGGQLRFRGRGTFSPATQGKITAFPNSPTHLNKGSEIVFGQPGSIDTGNISFLTTLGSGGRTVRLTINSSGSVNFQPLASAPTSAVAGDVYYDSGTNKLRCYNGTIWNDLF